MTLLPEHIQERIILDAIIFKKNEIGWKDIHLLITGAPIYLIKTNYVFGYFINFENAHRLRFIPPPYCRFWY